MLIAIVVPFAVVWCLDRSCFPIYPIVYRKNRLGVCMYTTAESDCNIVVATICCGMVPR